MAITKEALDCARKRTDDLCELSKRLYVALISEPVNYDTPDGKLAEVSIKAAEAFYKAWRES